MGKDDAAKLGVLLRHWVEHNEEHAAEFTEWALKAKASGRAAVHDHMMRAVRQMKRANASLLAAMEGLEEG